MMVTKRLPTAQRQRQIAEAALRIISTQGVHRLTTVAIADHVGIADGTIFRHFRNKKEIVDAAIGLFQTAFESTFPSNDRAPLERLGSFFVNRLTLIRANPDFLRLAFSDRLSEAAGEEGAERISRLVERSIAFVFKCLKEAKDRGEIDHDIPPIILTWMIIGVIRGASTFETRFVPDVKPLSAIPPKQVWEILETFLRGATKEKNK